MRRPGRSPHGAEGGVEGAVGVWQPSASAVARPEAPPARQGSRSCSAAAGEDQSGPMSALPGDPTILYINHEMAASGATVHRDEFVSAARALGANLIQYPHPRTVQEGRVGFGLRQRFKQWFYTRWTELALLLMVIKRAPGEGWALLRTRPDVALVNFTVHAFSILFGRAFGIPVILQIHCPYYLHADYADERLRLVHFWKWLEKLAIGMASRVVVVSTPLQEYYVALGFPRDKFVVVPNGVDLLRFDPALCADRVRERFGLQGSLVIGFIGGLAAWTGIDWFLEALPRLESLLDNVAVLIIGSGSLESRIRQVVAESGLEGRIRFAGFIPHEQVPEHLAAFDIAVAPYRKVKLFYNSPMKLHEYLAMGKPVIASRMGQSAELITNGENGFLYEPDDAGELLALLRLLIQDADLRRRLGRAARTRSRAVAWTWEKNAAAILELGRVVAGQASDTETTSRGSG